MVATIAVVVTLPSCFPESVVCVLQGNMGLPGLSGNPGPLGRKVGLGSVLGLGHGLASKLSLTFKQKHRGPPVTPGYGWVPWAQSPWAREERFLNPECAGVGSPLV